MTARNLYMTVMRCCVTIGLSITSCMCSQLVAILHTCWLYSLWSWCIWFVYRSNSIGGKNRHNSSKMLHLLSVHTILCPQFVSKYAHKSAYQVGVRKGEVEK